MYVKSNNPLQIFNLGVAMKDITSIKNKYKRRVLLCVSIMPLVLASFAVQAFKAVREAIDDIPEIIVMAWKGRE